MVRANPPTWWSCSCPDSWEENKDKHWTQQIAACCGNNFPYAKSISKISPRIRFYGQCFNGISDYKREMLKVDCDYDDVEIHNIVKLIAANCDRPKVILMTHGFMSSSDKDWVKEMRNGLVEIRRENVVGVLDWGNDAKFWARGENGAGPYLQAAANCLEVGEWLGKIVEIMRSKLDKERFTKFILGFKIWGIGHSLGSHLIGRAGDTAYDLFDRIVGLDPAGPAFVTPSHYRSLCKSDAKMVDVIHTDGGPKVPYFGTLKPMGTIDFYPNYGKNTYSSLSERVKAVHHSLAFKYFTWSIDNPGEFLTTTRLKLKPKMKLIFYQFEKEAEMGYYADKHHIKGRYYLKTNMNQPYAPFKHDGETSSEFSCTSSDDNSESD